MVEGDRWTWTGPEPAPDFAMMPGIIGREIIRHLSGSEWKVLYLLAWEAYISGKPTASISLRKLEQWCGISRATVMNALRGLVEDRLIEPIDLRELGSAQTAVYRVLITADRRYVARQERVSSGSIIDPGGGSIIDPPLDQKLIHPPLVSLSYMDKRGERSRARARARATPSEDRNKFYEGRYAMCRRCGQLHCDCEDR